MNIRTKILQRMLLILLFGICACQPGPRNSVKLVVIISVDQLPSSYLDRFKPLLHGGIKRLLDRGAVFKRNAYTHADTATCPGHAVISTGTHPSRNGIISNWWYDRSRKEERYCVQDDQHDRSPEQLLVRGLPDWIHQQASSSHVYSISGKDRAAIMLGGKSADAAFWYNKEDGSFTSSSYYKNASPEWLRLFNDNKVVDSYFGELWKPLPTNTTLAHFAGIEQVDYGDFPNSFPHHIGSSSTTPNEEFYTSVFSTPFMDYALLEFAKVLIREEGLGTDSTIDYLGISFSALDPVGHEYGPDSFEVLDTVRRLDLILEQLFAYLDETVGLEHVLFAFTSDHGVQHFPEIQTTRGIQAHRQNATDVNCIQKAGKRLRMLHHQLPLFDFDLYFDRRVLQHAHIDEKALSKQLALLLEECPMIEKAWTATELSGEQSDTIEVSQNQFINSYNQKRSGDIVLQLKKDHLHTLWKGTGHGSPHPYDTHVPLIFMGTGIRSAHFPQQSSPLDIAPTLAGFLNIKAPKQLDGTDRSSFISLSKVELQAENESSSKP